MKNYFFLCKIATEIKNIISTKKFKHVFFLYLYTCVDVKFTQKKTFVFIKKKYFLCFEKIKTIQL